MISSMTGYGRGEVSKNRTSVAVEIRTVNSRYLEVSLRLPGSLTLRETEIKEIVRKKFTRGKINVSIAVTRENNRDVPLRINEAAAGAYVKLLTKLRKSAKVGGEITLDHLLKYPEVLEPYGFDDADNTEWSLTVRALGKASDTTARMRRREGSELRKDVISRLKLIGKKVDEVDRLASKRVPAAKEKLRNRLAELLDDRSAIDEHRLEQELALYADRLDLTEESVRFRSHMTFFLKTMGGEQSPGRKLNFLVQEMNREANTMGSKANDAGIAQTVVMIKEELEKIREQLQNIE
jgi:uncharacterized protein (TIGR00255 family)